MEGVTVTAQAKMSPIHLTDQDLLRRMLVGDEEAFTTLYRRWQRSIYRFALQMSGSVAVAEDVTQEVFMALIRQSQDYDPARGPVAAYLFGIARNLVRRSVKNEGSYVTMGDDPQVEENPSSELLINRDGPLEEFRRNETVATVWQAVQSLPAHYREVVVLCDLNELRYSDAASILGCSLGTVRSRLHRAHALLLNKLTRKKNDYPAEAGGAERCLA